MGSFLAITLRSVPFQERHLIVTAITQEQGRVTALAKNAIHSRRFGAALELFAASQWNLTQKPNQEMGFLNEAELKHPYERIRSDMNSFALASTLNEILLKIAQPETASAPLFQLHSNALWAIEENPPAETGFALLNAYLAKMLQWCGSQPRLLTCLGCSKNLKDLDAQEKLSGIIERAGWLATKAASAPNSAGEP